MLGWFNFIANRCRCPGGWYWCASRRSGPESSTIGSDFLISSNSSRNRTTTRLRSWSSTDRSTANICARAVRYIRSFSLSSIFDSNSGNLLSMIDGSIDSRYCCTNSASARRVSTPCALVKVSNTAMRLPKVVCGDGVLVVAHSCRTGINKPNVRFRCCPMFRVVALG